MRDIIYRLLMLALCSYEGYCGDVVFGFSPSNLRFGSKSTLRMSHFDDVIAASLGYTSEDIVWNGLTVTTPFNYPSAAVVFGVFVGGVPIKLEGATYDLKEDVSLKNVYADLTYLISNRAQRLVYFSEFPASDLVKNASSKYTTPSSKTLDIDGDSDFLKEMAVLPNLVDYIESSSTFANGGQDVIFVTIDSFAPLVAKYGIDSSQVDEASGILRSSLAQTISSLGKFYENRVLVGTVLLSDSEQTHIRTRRAFGDDAPAADLNLGVVYDEDYPVIFNIVLILSVILVVALIAISLSMVYMDVGKDSIIYRMTNPRMKKDQ